MFKPKVFNFGAKDLSIVANIYIDSPIQYVTCDCLFQSRAMVRRHVMGIIQPLA